MLRRCLAVALVLCASSATAQPAGRAGGSTRPVSLVVSGGLTLPSGELKDFHNTGFHYDVSLLINPGALPLVIRPELTLTRFGLKDQYSVGGSGSGYGGSETTQMLGALGNIEIPLAGGLYVLAGGGLLNLKANVTGSSTTTNSISQSKFTFDAGAGLRFKLGGIRGFAEGRIGTASYDQGKMGFSKAQFIPITFGLAF